jgi:hypothetical protein
VNVEKLRFVPRDYVMDSIKDAVLIAHDRPACQVCGYHMSENYLMAYSREHEASINIYACDNCEIEIRTATNKHGVNLFDVIKE